MTLTQSRLIIALMLPKEAEDYANQVIQELSNRYDTNTAKAPPHITLQPPFLLSQESMVNLQTAIATVAHSYKHVPILLSGFGCFAPRVLYINVIKTPELLMMQKDLMIHLEQTLGVCDSNSKQRPFTPHVTVASRNITPQKFKQAWSELKNREVRFEFVGLSLTLLKHDGHRWRFKDEFHFDGGSH